MRKGLVQAVLGDAQRAWWEDAKGAAFTFLWRLSYLALHILCHGGSLLSLHGGLGAGHPLPGRGGGFKSHICIEVPRPYAVTLGWLQLRDASSGCLEGDDLHVRRRCNEAGVPCRLQL